jgi:Na+/H+ antiporter NhaD/arsenite permease-like protein
MATPVGNPQNLYLYAFYNIGISDFFSVTLPLTVFCLVVLTVCATQLLPREMPEQKLEKVTITSTKNLVAFAVLFALCLLTVFRVIPYILTTVVTVVVLFWVNRKLLKEIDYMLLLTFVCFFTVSENLGRVEAVRTFLQQLLQWNTLLTAVGTSQVISNVPAAVLLSPFTDKWQELLAGVNIGGLGTPIASLASLISLKLYMAREDAKVGRFLLVFTAANVAGLVILLLFSML